MKETIEDTTGMTRREYPRLQYGGGHLADPMRQRAADVWWRVAYGIGAGLMGGVAIILFISGFISLHYREAWTACPHLHVKGTARTPIGEVLFGMGVVIMMIMGCLISTAGYYHVFGTDKVGEDVLYQSLKSIRTGLVIGTLTTLVMFAVCHSTWNHGRLF